MSKKLAIVAISLILAIGGCAGQKGASDGHETSKTDNSQSPSHPLDSHSGDTTGAGDAKGAPSNSPTGLSLAPHAVSTLDPATSVQIAEGKKLAEKKACLTCHTNGGSIINPAKTWKGEEFKKQYPDDRLIAEVVRHGVAGTAMLGFTKGQLSDEELGKIIV